MESVSERGEGWASPEKGSNLHHTQKRGEEGISRSRGREGDRSQSRYSQGDLRNLAIPRFTYFITEIPLRSIWNNVGK